MQFPVVWVTAVYYISGRFAGCTEEPPGDISRLSRLVHPPWQRDAYPVDLEYVSPCGVDVACDYNPPSDARTAFLRLNGGFVSVRLFFCCRILAAV